MAEIETIETEEVKQAELNYHQRFRLGREQTGYSAQAVGHAIGMSAQAMHQFEVGKQDLKLSRFVEACALLNLNVRWVLTGRGGQFEGGTPASAPKRGRTSKVGRPAKTAEAAAQPATEG